MAARDRRLNHCQRPVSRRGVVIKVNTQIQLRINDVQETSRGQSVVFGIGIRRRLLRWKCNREKIILVCAVSDLYIGKVAEKLEKSITLDMKEMKTAVLGGEWQSVETPFAMRFGTLES
ncbi:hypothetical protein PIB30_026498 [Stylosanthes scabra]|uniref:Uncharacterized protein n=1 Tax=Stylosanthes scabra TaxID=79078 RepID=A0ABU6YC86_9FABA|nr:hypothetical protein [Stylosanthes scabra]